MHAAYVDQFDGLARSGFSLLSCILIQFIDTQASLERAWTVYRIHIVIHNLWFTLCTTVIRSELFRAADFEIIQCVLKQEIHKLNFKFST